jgi:heat shock protein HslJ
MKLKLLIISLFLILLVGCEINENPIQDKNPSFPERKKIEFQTILQTSDLLFYNDSLITVVLYNKQDELEFLSQNPIVQISRSFPDVDYNKYTVIGILLGARPHPGYKIQIDSVIDYGAFIKVYSHEYQIPVPLDILGFPIHFIVINKTDLPIFFEDIKVIETPVLDTNKLFNRWDFLFIENILTGEKYFPPREMRTLYINFSRSYFFAGSTPCNYISGDFQLNDNNRITISNLQTTLMACQSDTLNYWEGLYVNGLLNVNKYEITSDTLRLLYNQNTKALVYRRF